MSQLGRADYCACPRTSQALEGVSFPTATQYGLEPLGHSLGTKGTRPRCRSKQEKQEPTAGRPSSRGSTRAAAVPHLPSWSSCLSPRPSRDPRREGVRRAAVAHPSAARHYLSAARPHQRCRCAPPKSGMLREGHGGAEPARVSRACAPRAVGPPERRVPRERARPV